MRRLSIQLVARAKHIMTMFHRQLCKNNRSEYYCPLPSVLFLARRVRKYNFLRCMEMRHQKVAFKKNNKQA